MLCSPFQAVLACNRPHHGLIVHRLGQPLNELTRLACMGQCENRYIAGNRGITSLAKVQSGDSWCVSMDSLRAMRNSQSWAGQKGGLFHTSFGVHGHLWKGGIPHSPPSLPQNLADITQSLQSWLCLVPSSNASHFLIGFRHKKQQIHPQERKATKIDGRKKEMRFDLDWPECRCDPDSDHAHHDHTGDADHGHGLAPPSILGSSLLLRLWLHRGHPTLFCSLQGETPLAANVCADKP